MKADGAPVEVASAATGTGAGAAADAGVFDLAQLTRGRLVAQVAIAALAAALAAGVALLVDIDVVHGSRIRLVPLAELTGRRFLDYRVPRVLGGALVGACLSGAGCAFQAVLRNPLAEPYALGVSSGASLAAFLAIHLGIDQTFLGASGVSLAALLGAAATVVVVWRLARVGEDLPPATLLLAGVTIALFCSAASMFIQYMAGISETQRMVRWLMGGLDGLLMPAVERSAPIMAVGLGLLMWLARDLNALSAGGEAAASVGVEPRRATALTFATASLLVGGAIALAGPIGFVGLLVPHAVRALVGPDHRVLLPCSMLGGAALLVLCDGIARVALAPAELPVGVVTALLGGPFFLYLLLRSRTPLWG